MGWTHFLIHLKLFILHMESAEVSVFLFLLPVQTVKNKSKAPDIILLQQWSDWFFFLVKYFVSTWCYFQKGTGWRHALE